MENSCVFHEKRCFFMENYVAGRILFTCMDRANIV